MSADTVPSLPHLVFHLVNVLFNFLIFDSFLFDLIGQLGDRESGVYASGVLQKSLVYESVLALVYVEFKITKTKTYYSVDQKYWVLF